MALSPRAVHTPSARSWRESYHRGDGPRSPSPGDVPPLGRPAQAFATAEVSFEVRLVVV